MSILTKLLEKRGIKDVHELDSEEKVNFENWQRILSKEDIEINDISEFCKTQLAVIEQKFKDVSISDTEKARMTLVYSVYASIRDVIGGKRMEREALEKYLVGLLEQST